MTSDGAMPWTHMAKVPALLAARTRLSAVMVAFSQPTKRATDKQTAMLRAIGGSPAGSINVAQQLSPLSALSC